MKASILTIFLITLGFAGQAQDMLYKKDGSAIIVKVLAVSVDMIKYKRLDIKKSPVYEIKKEDVYKIKYRQGEVEILDQQFNKAKVNNTTAESLIYILYDSQGTSIDFPLYLNRKKMFKFKDYSRAVISIHSEGEIEFFTADLNRIGPRIKMVAVNGTNYAINIKVENPNSHDLDKKFSMVLIQDSLEVTNFIERKYNGFSPDKDHDFKMREE